MLSSACQLSYLMDPVLSGVTCFHITLLHCFHLHFLPLLCPLRVIFQALGQILCPLSDEHFLVDPKIILSLLPGWFYHIHLSAFACFSSRGCLSSLICLHRCFWSVFASESFSWVPKFPSLWLSITSFEYWILQCFAFWTCPKTHPIRYSHPQEVLVACAEPSGTDPRTNAFWFPLLVTFTARFSLVFLLRRASGFAILLHKKLLLCSVWGLFCLDSEESLHYANYLFPDTSFDQLLRYSAGSKPLFFRNILRRAWLIICCIHSESVSLFPKDHRAVFSRFRF